MKLADQVLATEESKQTSAAAAATRPYWQPVQNLPANRSVHTTRLQPSTSSGEKLTAAQVSAVQSQIEDALQEQVIKINALAIRPSGQTAVRLASEAETREAVDQLDTVAHVTGCTAEGIAEKHARWINHNQEYTQ